MRTTSRKLQGPPVLGLAFTNSPEGNGPDRKQAAASTAKVVVNFLNAKPNEGTKRVIDLIEGCHRISESVEAIKAADGPAAGQNPEVTSAVLDLNMRLGKYKWQPAVYGSMADESHFKIFFVIVGVAFDHALAMEHYAVQWIVERVDAVQRLRRCQIAACRKWFYAKTHKQKYCRGACRQRDAARADSFKEKRRVYMRERYRPQQRELERRALERAKQDRRRLIGVN